MFVCFSNLTYHLKSLPFTWQRGRLEVEHVFIPRTGKKDPLVIRVKHQILIVRLQNSVVVFRMFLSSLQIRIHAFCI